VAAFSLSSRQKAVAFAVGIIPLGIAGIALLRCGCALNDCSPDAKRDLDDVPEPTRRQGQ
jgi:hypothetical protein